MALAIEATGLTKSYDEVRVLDGVDLTIGQGEVFALLGPNGAGKTTAVRILATLTEADSGRAVVAGHDVVRERGQVRRRISLTGQYAALDGVQTGRENLRMMGRLQGLSGSAASARAAELLTRFALEAAADRRVATYSGGMRRRLDLAVGLVTQPEVIFLDEPTTGLDPRSRQAMWDVVTGLAGDGVTVFLTTQYLDEADQLADRIAVIDAGRVVAEGTVETLKEQVSASSLELRMAHIASYHDVLAVLGSRVIRADVDRLSLAVSTGGAAAEIRGLLDEVDPGGTRVDRFDVHTTTLDDVFFALTGAASTTTDKETADV